MSSSAAPLAGSAAVRASWSVLRGLGPYSMATSWISSARHFSPLLAVYSRGVKAPAEADGLALDKVLGGGVGLAFPDDEVDEQRGSLVVAPVAGDRDASDAFAAVGAAQLD